MEMRTDRVGLLLDQLETSVELTRERLTGLTDEEYLWEPVPGAWSIRRRADATTSKAYGSGDWVLDFGEHADPAPVTTIAWRLGHLVSMFDDRWEWTFGSRSIAPEVATAFTPSADEALEELWAGAERWAHGVAGLTDEQLDTVGFGQYPYGLDPQLPIVSIVWWLNREFIHHAAEVALLRDLYLRRPGADR
jgi:hypothetical protein